MRTLTIFAEYGIMAHNTMAKPMKTLELHYPMIQFLIIICILPLFLTGLPLRAGKAHLLI